MEGTVDGLLYR